MKKNLDKILTEISAGELIDKITILEIKNEKISNTDKLIDIKKELASLKKSYEKNIPLNRELNALTKELKKINLKLWDIEEKKRLAEKNNKFDNQFIQLARDVYKFNDQRAKIKLQINVILGSNIREVKSYY